MNLLSFIKDKNDYENAIIDFGKIFAPNIGEYHLGVLFNLMNNVNFVKHEPEGSGKHPDFLIKLNDGTSIYVEAKCIKKQDDEKLTINNATNSEHFVRQYINEFKSLGYNKFKETGTRDTKLFFETITVFLYYKVDLKSNAIVYYDYDIIPFPIAIQFELTKDGYLLYDFDNENDTEKQVQLVKKSNGKAINKNVCLNLKFIDTFNNNYNLLSDPLELYLTGYTHLNKDHIISNLESNYNNFLTNIDHPKYSKTLNELYVNHEIVKKLVSNLKNKNT